MAWGGPSRIRLEPELWVQKEWPKPDSDLIVLAQLELDENCAVRDVHTFMRQHIGAAQATKVRALSLEGEKFIDAGNHRRIYFHVEGGIPNSVVLYLRGGAFPSYQYTEIGRHKHDIDITIVDGGDAAEHQHLIPELVTSDNRPVGLKVSAKRNQTRIRLT